MGEKSNVFCIVDNTKNLARRHCGGTYIFDDDCCAWLSAKGHTCEYSYLSGPDGSLRRIFFIKSMGLYCREVKEQKKRSYIPLEPQPADNSLIHLTRHTMTLKAAPSYRRRITVMTSGSDRCGKLAVVEYLGTHVVGAPHGNTKSPATTAPYIRTPAATMEAVVNTAHLPPKVAYNKLTAQLDIQSAPRDAEVLRNKRKNERRQQRREEGIEHCENFADEWLAVYTKMQTDGIVRFLGAEANRVPSVILYSDDQMRDLKSFCFNRRQGSVLSFDKTFNLGNIYVTPSVYRHKSLIRRRDAEQRNPIFIGPVFIHGHSDITTYSVFFGHLAARLMDCEQSELLLGSDDELAMRKCMANFFPRAATIVCSRHLKQNVTRKLETLLGSKTDLRRTLFNCVCGDAGLMSCKDIVAFDEQLKKMRANELLLGPTEFREYCERRLIPILRANVSVGMNSWTNNNCESINGQLKQYVQWRPQQLPALIDTLKELIEAQQREADKAMVGRGEFQLVPELSKHRLTVDVWANMSEQQKNKLRKACFRLPTDVPTCMSTDGTFTVPLTPGGGKKPNQVKRRRNAKTVSLSKRLKTYD